jgi:hypothetical protein
MSVALQMMNLPQDLQRSVIYVSFPSFSSQAHARSHDLTCSALRGGRSLIAPYTHENLFSPAPWDNGKVDFMDEATIATGGAITAANWPKPFCPAVRADIVLFIPAHALTSRHGSISFGSCGYGTISHARDSNVGKRFNPDMTVVWSCPEARPMAMSEHPLSRNLRHARQRTRHARCVRRLSNTNCGAMPIRSDSSRTIRA